MREISLKRRRSFFAGVLLLYAAVTCSDALAQTPPPPPPTYLAVDPNGVNLLDATFTVSEPPLVSIGQPGSGQLTYSRRYDGAFIGIGLWRDNLTSQMSITQVGSPQGAITTYIVTFRGSSSTFTKTGNGPIIAAEGQGDSLAFNSGSNTYTFTSALGAVVNYALIGGWHRATTGAYPSGEVVTFTYRTVGSFTTRLQSVTNNFGYQIKLEYESDDDNTGAALARVIAINNAIDYCDPAASQCTGFTQAWPTATFTGLPFPLQGVQTVTDPLGRVTRYTFNQSLQLVGIRRPSSSVDNVTITYQSAFLGRVTGISNGAGTWTYLGVFVFPSGAFQVTVTDPQTSQVVYTTNAEVSRLASVRDGLNRTTASAYDSFRRLTRITQPEGNYIEYTYDARGNITHLTRVAKPGAGLANIQTRAIYPATCAGLTPAVCNRPTAAIDERGFQTDYTYNPTHGGVLTAAAASPGAGAPRPQVRYTYTALYAWYRNSFGVLVQAPSPIERLTQTSSCASGSSCAGGSNELVEAFTYGAPGVANNLLPTASTRRAGDNSISATNTVVFSSLGDPVFVDGPLPGATDTTRYLRDIARQLVGTIGPDPDGAGSRKNEALRTTYNLDGQVTSTEYGAVNGQSDADWANFISFEQTLRAYDPQGREIRDSLVTQGVVRGVTQHTYDSANRLQCTATRMNDAVFGALPASACTLGTEGAHGPDRVTRNTYDAADQLVSIESAVGTTAQQFSARFAYTTNGMRQWLEDGNGNRSDFTYDGFDRLMRVNFPQPTVGAHASNPADFRQFSYDAASNLTQERLRDAQLILYGYDNLNRRTAVNPPGVQDDASFTFDNHNQMTGANSASQAFSFVYDALGRVTSENGPIGAVASIYDSDDRRIRLTWPDGFFVTYDYDVTGSLIAIRENGAGSGVGVLAQYSYNDLGQRTLLSRGNASTSIYTYGLDRRLQSLEHDFASTANDQTYTFAYNAAAEVATRTMSNNLYIWPQPPAGTDTYTRNGRNQYLSVGGAAVTYDARGNQTSSGGATLQFDQENRLVSASNGAAFAYDPMGRLFQASGAGASTQFLYDGDAIIAEYNGAALVRRYVHDQEDGEAVVWYEGSGTIDRRWLYPDERGSVVAGANVSGASIFTNTYDEYGRPGASNQGRFQYAGGAWLPEVSLSHFGARAYSPTLGRFLQSDPILYRGGLNLYAYAGNDPINATDLSGLLCIPSDVHCSDQVLVTAPRPRELEHVIVTALRPPQWIPAVLSGPGHQSSPLGGGPVAPSLVLVADEENEGGHRTGRRESTRERHEAGDARRARDRAGERGDERRPLPRRKPRGHRGPWPPPGSSTWLPFPSLLTPNWWTMCENGDQEACNLIDPYGITYRGERRT